MQQMARQHDGETKFITQPLNQHANLAQSLRIKSVSWFIQNDELRIRQQSLGDAEALTHAMRIDAHGIASTLAQAHDLQNHFNALSLCAAGHGREHSQVLSPGKILVKGRRLDDGPDALQCPERLARHVVSEDAHTPGRWTHKSQRHSNSRGFSGSVLAQKAKNIALLNH